MGNRAHDRGFTLVELLVVVLVIGVLTSIALPAFAAQTRKAKLAALKSALKSAATVQEERATDGEPYAVPGPVGLAQLVASGYVETQNVELTVVDDAMAGGGFCLRAHHTSLPADQDLYYASSGPAAGRPSATPCAAS